MKLLRRNSACEYARSIKEVGEDPGVAGKETVVGIEAECRDLGLAAFTQKGGELVTCRMPVGCGQAIRPADGAGYRDAGARGPMTWRVWP